MGWNLFFWLVICFPSNIALLASTFYQVLILSDLEADYINPFDASSRINYFVLPEFIGQGMLCALCLFTGHWFMFLLTLPVTCYHLMLFKSFAGSKFTYIYPTETPAVGRLLFYAAFGILVHSSAIFNSYFKKSQQRKESEDWELFSFENPAYLNFIYLLHLKWYVKREHLIDVTEVFRVLNAEKKFRIAKLAMYLVVLIVTIFRLTLIGVYYLGIEDDDNIW